MNLIGRLLLLFLLLASPILRAQVHVTAPNGRAVSEWWYEPTNPGWGLVLTHSGSRTVVLYAGFDAQGRDLWQVGVGARRTGELSADLLQSHWDVATDRVDRQWVAGSVEFRYLGPDQAEAVIRQGDSVRTASLSRIISTRQSSVDDYSGLWHNPSIPGFGMALLTQGPVLAVLASAYDRNGDPRWWLGYKLSRPNDPAPFVAKRFRRNCNGISCTMADAAAGSISIQPRNEREISAKLHFTEGFAPLPETLVFANFGRYSNLGESASGRVYPSDARPFHSEAALNDYLTLAESGIVELPYGCIDFSPAPPGTSVGPAGSVTNTQEAGIDEGDIIARSGDLVVNRTYVTLFSDPPISVSRFGLTRVSATTPAATHVAALETPVLHHVESALVLPAPPGRHRFAVLSSNRHFGFALCNQAVQNLPPETAISVFEVNGADQVSLVWRYVVAARPGVLRLQGDALLLLTSAPVAISISPDGSTRQLLRPTWQLNSGVATPLLRPDNTWLGDFQPGMIGTTVMSAHRLPIAAPEQVRHFSFLSTQGNMYVGPESVYMTSVRTEPAVFTEDNQVARYRTLTNVHRLDQDDLSWRGSADVPGLLAAGYSGTWAMQEHRGTLRVLTTFLDQSTAQTPSAARLTVLKQSDTERRLLVAAQLPNTLRPQPIGRVDERIHAVRFAGDRLNVVSFRNIDPLYAIDLSDPVDPKITAELDISGYSEYLHPMPNGQLLGFGVEVDATGSNWFQPDALKISLFAGNGPGQSLTTLQSFQFGERFSELPVMYDSRALAVLQTGGDDVWLTAPARLSLSSTQTVYGPLSVLRIRYSRSAGRVIAANVIPISDPASIYDDTSDARTVIYGDQLYYFYRGLVFGAPLTSPVEALPLVL